MSLRPRANFPFDPHVGDWRCEPLAASSYRLGEGPIRVRGLAYQGALEYVDKRMPGGRATLKERMAGEPWLPYFDQLFVISGDYDLSPLVRLYVELATLSGSPIANFVARRSAWSARANIEGMWKPMLMRPNPVEMADRLHLAFNRYFSPAHAQPVSSAPGRFQGELQKLAAPMAGLFVHATAGFFQGALELVGARDVRATFGAPRDDGRLDSIALQRVPFVVEWT